MEDREKKKSVQFFGMISTEHMGMKSTSIIFTEISPILYFYFLDTPCRDDEITTWIYDISYHGKGNYLSIKLKQLRTGRTHDNERTSKVLLI